ncbi:glycosyl hydrolase family 8 [Curtobacterium sp. C1]|uniref:glycosyl hydrolase family 8 n=1 Tax=Curtobacterium TaxID=2034 RepID=UPI001E3B1F8D|nr:MULTISPECIES: glycosyl hydrolase family 8 [Curtobacterium]MCS5486629.1 glycosyl hydrolase family 8 [Curtobacterium flaccumfaciens pv. basellae]UFU15029.1 glycosyl hydrolase family 8 [Curtobacterium sp. C1]WIJ46305.1 glycosyl hydrolase family 8 [Curtobacterium citreum]
MTRRTWIPIAAAATLVVAVGIALVAVRPWGGAAPQAAATSNATSTSAPDVDRSAAQLRSDFLDRYVRDGRVVRTDQGGDTVSEGQAYGLLIAYANDDRETFRAIWSWTERHLLTDDHLLAWRWTPGKGVADEQPASDADLDAARALVLAGDRWDDPRYTAAGKTLAAAILEHETARTDLGTILLPGPWADQEPYRYNASYASPAAFRVLERATGDRRWGELDAGSHAATAAVLDRSDLPSDWSQVHADGSVDPMPASGDQGQVVYGWDAMRLPLRYAESCSADDRALAGSLAPTLRRSTELAAQLDLGGSAVTSDTSALAYAARAAAERAGGAIPAASADLRRSDRTSATTRTYYGDAWAALGATMLTSNLLGGCGTDAGSAS